VWRKEKPGKDTKCVKKREADQKLNNPVMNCKVVDFEKNAVVYNITGTSKAELDNKLNLFFTSENLPLRKDTGEERVYQKGNKVMRILFGVFVKYFKLEVTIKQQDELFSVRLHRDMGLILSGGLMGIKASRKEFERINEAFKIYFNN
jgi:hypothetical protein